MHTCCRLPRKTDLRPLRGFYFSLSARPRVRIAYRYGFCNAPRCLWRTSWNAATSKGSGRFFIKVALTVAILLMVFPAFLLLPGVPCLLWLFGIRRQTGSFCDMRHLAYCADMEARHAISLGRALVFCPWRRVYGCELFGRHARAGTKSELVRRLGQIMR